MLKAPQQRRFYYRSYDNAQWKMLRLEGMDLSTARHMALYDGTDGIKDMTDGTA